MPSYLLIPGAGGDSWSWHGVISALEAHGHSVIAPDLPAADPSAGLNDYVDTAVRAAHDAHALTVVGHSLGGLTAPVAAEQLGAEALILVAAMIPSPGESGGEWWEATGQPDAAAEYAAREGRATGELFDPVEVFFHDLTPDLLAEVMQRPSSEQSDGPFSDPWPLTQWPSIPTRVIAGRYDRLFPLEFMQRVSRDRLGIEPEVVDTGHMPALANPHELVELMLAGR